MAQDWDDTQGKTDANFRAKGLFDIEPEIPTKIIKANPSKIVAFCKFKAMKSANDVKHDFGDKLVRDLQTTLQLACYAIKRPDKDYWPVWRISVTTYVVIMDESEKWDFKKQFDKDLKTTLKDSLAKFSLFFRTFQTPMKTTYVSEQQATKKIVFGNFRILFAFVLLLLLIYYYLLFVNIETKQNSKKNL